MKFFYDISLILLEDFKYTPLDPTDFSLCSFLVHILDHYGIISFGRYLFTGSFMFHNQNDSNLVYFL